jgi:peptidyl-prolyl cis-trans isomerase C
MKKKIEFFICLAVLFAFRCGTKIEQSDIIAKVGNAVLTKQELQSLMVNQGYSVDEERTFVDRWIHRELLYQEALRQHIQQSDDLQKELVQIEKELMINKLLERTYKEKIRLSEEEIRSYYDQNVTDFRVIKDEVRIQHILLKTRSDANLALQEITAGNSFESVAKSRSIDEFAEQGGEMGYVCREDVIPEIQRQAFRLSDNQVSPIIHTEFGYHIIKVLDHRSAGDLRPLAEVRPEIMQRLRVIKEGQVYYDLLYQLQNQNKYYVIQPSLPGVDMDTLETQ